MSFLSHAATEKAIKQNLPLYKCERCFEKFVFEGEVPKECPNCRKKDDKKGRLVLLQR